MDALSSALRIAPARPDAPEIAAVIARHLAQMRSQTPEESVHAKDAEALEAAGVQLVAAWRGAQVLGIGGLAELAPGAGEIKSMHVVAEARGQGVGAAILRHLLGAARDRGLRRVCLETGASEAFAAGRALYARHGFVPCGPFGSYGPDPESAFMELVLEA